MSAVLTAPMLALAAQFAGPVPFEVAPLRMFHVRGRLESGEVYDVTAQYTDGFAAINAAIDAGALGAVARPLGPVTEADIEAAREYIADVHNQTQMLNACGQLRREVVMAMADRGFVPSFFGSAS